MSLCALPAEFTGIFTEDKGRVVKNWHLFFCVCTGLWGGLIIGLVTEYFTSNRYQPVRVSHDSFSRILASIFSCLKTFCQAHLTCFCCGLTCNTFYQTMVTCVIQQQGLHPLLDHIPPSPHTLSCVYKEPSISLDAAQCRAKTSVGLTSFTRSGQYDGADQDLWACHTYTGLGPALCSFQADSWLCILQWSC